MQKLTEDQQKIFDELLANKKKVHDEKLPVQGEIWLGNAHWKRHQKAEIIEYEETPGQVLWMSLQTGKFWKSYIRDFKAMYSSPDEWRLSDELASTMEGWNNERLERSEESERPDRDFNSSEHPPG